MPAVSMAPVQTEVMFGFAAWTIAASIGISSLVLIFNRLAFLKKQEN